MAKALKCDRCGKLYETYNGIRYQEGENPYFRAGIYGTWCGRDFDLCPDCMTELINFFKDKQQTTEDCGEVSENVPRGTIKE